MIFIIGLFCLFVKLYFLFKLIANKYLSKLNITQFTSKASMNKQHNHAMAKQSAMRIKTRGRDMGLPHYLCRNHSDF